MLRQQWQFESLGCHVGRRPLQVASAAERSSNVASSSSSRRRAPRGKLRRCASRPRLTKITVAGHTMWIHWCAGNAAAGAVPFRGLGTICAVCDKDAIGLGHLEGTVLQLARAPHVDTAMQLPFGGNCDVGYFEHVTHWDVAARVLGGGRGTMPPLSITFALQKNIEVLGDLPPHHR